MLFIAGDIHLGGGPSAFALWLDWLAVLPPARLVLLGDLFDYWLETDGAVERYRPVLERLRGLRARGWRLDLVRGNREIVAGRRLEAASGCRMHFPALDLRLGPRRVRVVHGDRLCHDPGYHLFSAWMRSFWHRGLHACNPPVVQEAVARFLRRRSQAKRRRQLAGPRDIKRRVFIDRRRVQGAARGIDTLVAGHIHESWRRRIGGIDLILVGDWPGTVGHWIEGYADGHLERVRRDLRRMG